jgi:hypothetical protein
MRHVRLYVDGYNFYYAIKRKLRIPGEGERDSGVKPNRVPG